MDPGPDEIRAARRAVYARRRRRYPNAKACGRCCWPWKIGRTPSGRPARGCVPRRAALDVLDAAGQLDELGRPTPAADDPGRPTPSSGADE